MKTTIFFKEAILLMTFVISILLIASCNSNQQPEDSKEVAEEYNEEKFDDKNQEKDAQFLVDAAEINLEEIQLGQLAQQKGTTSHVKELGRMMESAHTQLQNELSTLANRKSISIPTSPTDDVRKSYEKLNEKSGIDFDKAYADKMVRSHKDAISDFEKASTDCEDPDIKNWATAKLPDLRKHLEHSLECQRICDEL